MGTKLDAGDCFFYEPLVNCTNDLRTGPGKRRCTMDKRCPYYVPTEWMAKKVANYVKEQAYIYRMRRIYGTVHDMAVLDELKGDAHGEDAVRG